MKIQIISGSHRLNSESLKVSRYLKKVIESEGNTAQITDLSRNALPLWDERVWENDPSWAKVWSPIAVELKAADAIIIVVPEYHGMAAPAMKNFFLFCTGEQVAHKPALLVGVSAGMGGSYPIAEMRSSSYKNCRINYIPDHLIIREAAKVLVDETAVAKSSDEYIRRRIDYSLKMLVEYAKALKLVRESGSVDLKAYPNGM